MKINNKFIVKNIGKNNFFNLIALNSQLTYL